jgi:hypothetical protein
VCLSDGDDHGDGATWQIRRRPDRHTIRSSIGQLAQCEEQLHLHHERTEQSSVRFISFFCMRLTAFCILVLILHGNGAQSKCVFSPCELSGRKNQTTNMVSVQAPQSQATVTRQDIVSKLQGALHYISITIRCILYGELHAVAIIIRCNYQQLSITYGAEYVFACVFRRSIPQIGGRNSRRTRVVLGAARNATDTSLCQRYGVQ